MPLPTVSFAEREVPRLGQGTWRMGEDPGRHADETAAIRGGVERGLTLVDTAEMYGEGATESFLGAALAGLRDAVTLVSKVYPQNAGGAALKRACEGSLRRLKTDRLDLYLLHWRGRIPLAETVAGFEALQAEGKILAWGVSNLDVDDLEDLGDDASRCATNQILYNLSRRGPEFDLLPWMRRHAMPAMAYSPLEQGRLDTRALGEVARRHGATPWQVALAWLLRQPDVVAIPKAGTLAHVEANLRAADLDLTEADCRSLDRAFPPPGRKVPLEML